MSRPQQIFTAFVVFALAACASPSANTITTASDKIIETKRIALTFDDVPRMAGAFFTPEERTAKLISALEQAGVEQAAFFVTTGNLSEPDGLRGEERIAAYVAAGHVIANHSASHSHLRQTPAAAYLADIDTAEAWLKGRPGYRPWFRHPYLDEGGRDKAKRDAIRAGLAERGLRNGYVTADGSDWHLEALTIKAAEAGKPMDMKALRKLYLQTQLSGIDYHDVLAKRTLGRSPAHVMLLHETDLAAMFIGDLVTELRREGWTIITADEAFADPINTAMPDVPYSYGTLIGSMAWEQDIQPPFSPIWMSTDMASRIFERQVIKAQAPIESPQ
ncbi:polysaccharide deacetylase family protein [Alteripontixanthobacter maritimus]|uniref:polysaccharide deacetylase family protein n=1 Tax=Alteripontixanthobacter maritimus TaxID=2161824 RepID=UPI001E29995D|nr:polysaccharide deacetylase family protein [Alteripontixanthobacter maritimus]